MTAPPTPTEAPLARLSALAARGFGDPADAIAAILDLARDLLGLTTAVVTRSEGDTWRAVHVADAAFGLAPGATLPLRDTFCSLVGADEAVVITDAPNDPRSQLVLAPARLGVRTFLGVPLVLRDGSLYGTLCALDWRASALGEEAVATLRVLARLVVHELEHARHLAEARDEQEQRFRALVQHASDGITVIGADGAVRYQSPAVARMLGYGPGELDGIDPFDLIVPEDVAPTQRLLAQLTNQPGGSRSTDLRVRHRDSSHRVLDATFTNLLDDPRVGGIVINTRDVTARKRAEAALAASEARFRALVQNGSDVVSILAADGTVGYQSPAVERVLGYAPEELEGQNVLAFVHPEDVPRAAAAFAACLAEPGGRAVVEHRFRHKDGSWRDLEALGGNLLDDPAVEGIVVNCRDITDRKAAESAVREAEARYRALVEQLPLVIYTSAPDENGTPTYVSPQVEAVLGFASEEWVANPGLWIERLHPNDRDRVLAEVARTDAVGGPFRLEYRKVARDGRAIWVRDEAVLVRDEAGRPRYWQGFNIDVTERKAAEAASRESERRQRALLDAIPDLVFRLGRDGTYLDVNAAREEDLVAPRDALLGSTVDQALPPPVADRVMVAIARALEAGAADTFEYELILGGERRHFEARTAAASDDQIVMVVRDLTERRRAESALRLRDRAVAAVSDGIVIVDARLPDMPMVDVNPAFERMSGYPAAELLGRNCRILQGPGTDPDALAPFRAAIAQERERTTTLLNYRKDGTPFWNEVFVSPVRDAAGVTTHFMGVMRDVTERRRAEEQRERQTRHAALRADIGAALAERGEPGELLGRCTEAIIRHLDAAHATIWLLDEAGEALELAASSGPFSDPRTDVRVPIGHFRVGRVAQERAPSVADDLAASRQEGDKDWASRAGLTSFAGYPLLLEDRLVGVVAMFAPQPLADDALGALATVADVLAQGIERRRAEAALGEAEAKYRSLVERLPAVVYSERLLDGDPAAVPRYVAPQIAGLVGYSQAEWLADPAIWASLLHPDDRAAVFGAYERAERGGDPYRGEYRLVARDGRTVWVRDEAVLLRDEAGLARGWQGVMIDVTDRREAETRLREAEVRYRALVEQLPAIVTTQRVDGDALITTYVSPQVAAILGYSPDEVMAGEIPWSDLVHPDDREHVLAKNARANTTGDPFRAEYRQRARDGRWVWLRDEAVLVPGADGQPDYWLAVQFDVTGLKRTEAALRESEERLQRSLEAAQTASWEWDIPTGELTWSSNADAVFDRAVCTLADTHRRFLDLVHPDDRGRLHETGDAFAAEGDGYGVEYRVVGRDGQVRWFTDRGRTMGRDEDGRATRVTGVTMDVTARKGAEDALRRSEARFRALIQNGSDIVDILAVDGTVRYKSPSVERVLGYAPEELEGRNVFALIHAEDAPRVADIFAALVADPSGRAVVEFRFRHKDGSWRALEAIGVNLLDDAGVAGVVVNSRDVTDRRRAEAEVAQALVVQQAANAELERLSKTKSDFVSVVSHEFRTPLTSIQGFSELIRDEDLPPEEVREFADDINRNARRLARMTGNMLDLDRLQSGRMDLRRTPVDLNAIVCEIVATFRPASPRHAIVLDLDPDLPPLLGDRDRLAQVLTNLVDNAVKYAPDGGEITVASSRDGEIAHLAVSDRGLGIPLDALEAVFDRYSRVEADGHGGIPGTGLGLSIAREIVELHGGGIWAESEPGHGSTFHVVLPLADETDLPQGGTGKGRPWHAWFAARTPPSGSGGT